MGEIIKHKIDTQGAIIVNDAFMYKKSKDICAITLDCRSKRGEVCAEGSDDDVPLIILGADKETLYTKKGKTVDDMTTVSFPDFKGWSIFACNYSKYTVYICLIRN